MTWVDAVMKHLLEKINSMLRKFKYSILRMSLFVAGTLLICCSSEEQRGKAVVEAGLESFYKNDSTTFRSLLDSTTLALVDSLVYTHRLILHNDTLNEISVARTSNQDSLNFNCKVQTAQGGTGMFKVTVLRTDGDDKLYFGEEALLRMLKFEGEICNNIGKILYRGRMFPQSVRWFVQARKQNVAEAKYYLGVMYIHEMRFDDAIVVLEEAYKEGYKPALGRLTTALSFSGQKDRGIALLKTEAEKGDIDAMVMLGEALDATSIDEDTPIESFYWSKMAADMGSTDGMNDVAHFYLLVQ